MQVWKSTATLLWSPVGTLEAKPLWKDGFGKVDSKYSFLSQGGRRHVFYLKSRARKVFCMLGGTLG